MNVTQQNIDNLSAVITLSIEKNDYEQRLQKNMSDYRRKTTIKGFRQGMAPTSLIEKMHKHTALVEEINKLITEMLEQHIKDNSITLYGEPIAIREHNDQNDFDKQENFEFKFEIGISKEWTFSMSKDDKITAYTITVTDDEVEQRKQQILKQYGKIEEMNEVMEESVVVVDLMQGVRTIEDVYISLKFSADKEQTRKFLGKKVNDELEANIKQMYINETDLAMMLKVKKEELGEFEPIFTVKIKHIKQTSPALPNDETFKKIFGNDEIRNEDEFTKKLKEIIAEEHASECEHRFISDAYDIMLQKANIELPDAFLKRCLKLSNDGLTDEIIEKEYPIFADVTRRQMIRKHIIKEQQMELVYEEVLETAKENARSQMRMYGLYSADENRILAFANNMLSDDKALKQVCEETENIKIEKYIKQTVTLDTKAVSKIEWEELNKQK